MKERKTKSASRVVRKILMVGLAVMLTLSTSAKTFLSTAGLSSIQSREYQ